MEHTPGPWAWMHVGEQSNGYVVGTAFDRTGKQLSGMIVDRYDMADEILYRSYVGEMEGATCNYADARLIAAAPDLLAELQNIANAKPSGWDEEMRDQFREWAQSRARAAIAKATGKEANC